ncbi:hypothetical protein [Kribbella sp. CA-294648]|uniref:hypothetical protein n=1 Tax=Kribbella sp. CA-294648 TaxID=3239948 RepID=UPI003D94AE46
MTDNSVPLLVVDAANVVGSRPDGWWRDRAGAARRLLTSLQALPARLDEPTEIAVILEGAAKAAVDRDSATGTGTDSGTGSDSGSGSDYPELRIVLASGSGDDAIVDLVATAAAADNNRQITVVTADRGLRDRVEALGAQTTGPGWLRGQLPS